MPKAKSGAKRETQKSGIHPKDVAEFLNDLEQHQQPDDHPATPATPVDEPVAIEPPVDRNDQPEPEAPEEPGEPEPAATELHAAHKIAVHVDPSLHRPKAVKRTVVPDEPPVPPPTPPKEMRTMKPEGRRRNIRWGWIFAVATVLAVAAVAGFFVFNRTARFSGEHVELDISVDDTVASGSEITLTVRYLNQEPVDLVQSELNMEFPEGFTFEQANLPPSGKFNNSFALGTIKRGRVGNLTITGTVLGAVNDRLEFGAVLNYRPANFNSDFQSRATAAVKITSSILSLTIDGPNKLAPNASGTWTVTYRNTSPRALADVQIEAVYPEGLQVSKTEPAAQDRSSVWRFDELKEEEEGKLTISGTLQGDVGDSLELTIKAGLRTNAGVTPQAEKTLLIILVNTGLKTSVVVNGADVDSVIEVGDDLSYAIRLANQSDSELTNVTVKASLTGAALDISALENPAKGVVQDTSLTWTKNEVAGLEQIKPGQEVTVRFTVGSDSALAVEDDADLNPQIKAEIFLTSDSLPATNTPAATMITKIATVFRLTAEARYYDVDETQLGSGPLPPTVGETTAYRVRWAISNTTSEANTMVVKAVLPTHVFWTGKHISRDAGDIVFDPDTRTVSWTLNKVPAGTGSRLPTLKAEFEVSISPIADQVGQVVVLSETATATAKDSFTNKSLLVTQSSLTTDIPTDPKGTGKGEVEPA